MRKFKIIIETGIAGGDFEDVFEVDDDATPDEIHDEAKEIFFNYCNYSYHGIKDEEEVLFKSYAHEVTTTFEVVFFLKTDDEIFGLNERGQITPTQITEHLSIDELFYFIDLPKPPSFSNAMFPEYL
ncbi:hypothetical protein C9Z70_10275 [Escherichia coli]|uniref:DUF7167 family protein n=1 Tax=Escherichia coli TaxID=562 RepID=UPI000B184A4C|nr:hypothetical protein [Escherichia coli]EGM7791082.1 hypothetical protein [Escherichia coli]TJQ01445.1 hypothetical protein C9Z70_10275 [Escherichia coli]HAU9345955.1 hypothetical protein [Escherichia coli]HBB2114770.1 hypothetical protein [Escherichia coli]